MPALTARRSCSHASLPTSPGALRGSPFQRKFQEEPVPIEMSTGDLERFRQDTMAKRASAAEAPAPVAAAEPVSPAVAAPRARLPIPLLAGAGALVKQAE